MGAAAWRAGDQAAFALTVEALEPYLADQTIAKRLIAAGFGTLAGNQHTLYN